MNKTKTHLFYLKISKDFIKSRATSSKAISYKDSGTKRVLQIFCMANYTKTYYVCDFGSKLEVLNVPIMIQQHSDMDVRMSPIEPGWLI